MRINIRKNKFGYNTTIKNGEGEFEIKYYMEIQFKKGNEPAAESCYIEINDCFFSCYKKKDNSIVPKLIIMTYTVLKEYDNTKNNTIQSNSNIDNLTEIPDDTLLF